MKPLNLQEYCPAQSRRALQTLGWANIVYEMFLNCIINLIIILHFSISSALHFSQNLPNVNLPGEVASLLSSIPSHTVCIWSDDKTEITTDLVKKLIMLNKSVTTFELTQNNVLMTECSHNLLVLDSLADCTGMLSRGFHYTDVHDFYVLVVGTWEDSALTRCTEQFGTARATVLSLQEHGVFSLSSPLVPPRRFIQRNGSFGLENQSPTNLEGREINVATFDCSPFVIFDQGNNTGLAHFPSG